MDRQIDQDLAELKTAIATMGGYVEQSLEEVMNVFQNRNVGTLKRLHESEAQINKSHIEIDDRCLRLLAKNSPLAKDLRLILACIKMNADLERMGDQSVNIAHCCKHLFTQSALPAEALIPDMAILVRNMVRKALNAFMLQDEKLAREVLSEDDHVDEAKNHLFLQVVEVMKSNATAIETSLDLILISRNLERMADHATNIAEDVIFVATGDDVRHGATRAQAKVSI
jgi:phosphate transport system protein